MDAIRELWATVEDALLYGDWTGHLRAWWQVISGEVAVG